MECSFLIPRDLPGPSGGSGYNTAVIAALGDAGHDVHVHAIPGAWPRPTPEDHRAMRWALAKWPLAIVDGIIALAAPKEVEAATRRGDRVHILIHSLLSADPGLALQERASFAVSECEALRAASSSSAVSQWSLADVAGRCDGVHPHVVRPGTTPAPLARGSTPLRLLVLGALTPVKNQLHVLRALQGVTDLPWTLQIVGAETLDPSYTQRIRRFVDGALPAGRVTLTGALTGSPLEDVWDATNLLLLTSTSETFGMVVTEALARGVPAIVCDGTGAVEALTGSTIEHEGVVPPTNLAGAVIDPLNVWDLEGTLRRWLLDPGLRSTWRDAALERRSRLQSWAQTATELARILQT